MPVPSSLNDLSTTPALNSPAGSESPALVDDYLRTHAAFIKQVSDSKDTLDAANVKLTGNQTIAGTKTFSSPIAGSVTGSAGSLSGTVAIANGGTGQATASAGFDALKQAATDAYTGVVELATSAEAQAGTDTTRALTPARLKDAQIQRGTAVTLTNQTAVDFTGIPSWARRVTVMFSGVSTNGTSRIVVRTGTSGGVEMTGYAGAASAQSSGGVLETSGFLISAEAVASYIYHGSSTLSLLGPNLWVWGGTSGRSDGANAYTFGGSKTLSGPLDRIRITTVNGTDTFDAGSINISWE